MNNVAAYTRLAGVYDEIVVDPCYARWADFLDALWVADSPVVHTVLDVCCGTGLMAEQLVQRGYAVTGMDASSAMLERAAALLGSSVSLVEASLPELGVTGTFDAAISNFDGLNYLSPSVFTESLGRISEHLRPNGWLVFDLHTDAMMQFTIDNAIVTGESDGNAFVIRSDVNEGERTCVTTIDVDAREGEPFTEQHVQYFHSDYDVQYSLARAGFEEIRVLDEYTYRARDPETLRATWVARRR